ncbi:MAG: acylphosphatase [Symploca sp. SIO3C6]|uniref:acylphosphatase n=1 Tax=Symploca sp. SIO1C4 TaxID=2607765 RepID=A0A6B3NJE4_9CYAN|nr:acylphosphatase [Symploca sp. SIO3C6]NER29318.1 acylphosphatase [Symploca sp. SIO1C4]NET05358.1 acylphosphatase [Symploca sp. SIO2B6]
MQNISAPQEQIRAHVFISGRVQGVGYRYSTLHQAKLLGISGWVQNLFDGRVEAVFEGTVEAIQAMIRWCYQGPLSAVVQDVAVDYETPEGLQGFEVRR